ncbi:NAD(P)-binding domain-containing protein [Streptomyces sp. NPDC001933]|uniref:NAD(P)-binding domain-containing protein n=1 Tax=Streptomyces sp. NPDC001933 TaxID=3364626 RepID=UPI00369E8426
MVRTGRGRAGVHRAGGHRATGEYGTPFVPDVPGQADFGGRILHAADYRSPDAFAGQRVVVVGGGNSAIQIVAELGSLADTTLVTRRPIGWTPQRPLGQDLHWWLKHTRLDIAPIRRLLAKVPVAVPDDGHHRTALDQHGVDRRDVFSRFTADGIVWADGTKEEVGAVLLATGYRLAFPYLTGSGVLATNGAPLHQGGLSPAVPGLAFVGMEFQRSFSSKILRCVGRDAGHVLERMRTAVAGRTRIRSGGRWS